MISAGRRGAHLAAWRCRMGKRSDFPRVHRDDYETPAAAVLPLLPWLAPATRFAVAS
jgi:hypothetical protein